MPYNGCSGWDNPDPGQGEIRLKQGTMPFRLTILSLILGGPSFVTAAATPPPPDPLETSPLTSQPHVKKPRAAKPAPAPILEEQSAVAPAPKKDKAPILPPAVEVYVPSVTRI